MPSTLSKRPVKPFFTSPSGNAFTASSAASFFAVTSLFKRVNSSASAWLTTSFAFTSVNFASAAFSASSAALTNRSASAALSSATPSLLLSVTGGTVMPSTLSKRPVKPFFTSPSGNAFTASSAASFFAVTSLFKRVNSSASAWLTHLSPSLQSILLLPLSLRLLLLD